MIFGLGGAARTDRVLSLKTVMQIQLEVDGKCRIVLFEEWVEPVEVHLGSGEGMYCSCPKRPRQAGWRGP
jgi:hypothetical protein